MKRKLLFMTYSMPIGGIESALLSMLKVIDYSRFDVDLLLHEKTGERLGEVPCQVRVFDVSEKDRYFLNNAEYAKRKLLAGCHVGWALMRCYYAACRLFFRSINMNYDTWKHTGKYIAKLSGHYDAAIDYGGSDSRYILDKVDAKKKFVWNHFDYNYLCNELENDRFYFSKMDKIVSVSDEGTKTLMAYMPELSHKIFCYHNHIDKEMIKNKAKQEVDLFTNEELNNSLKICSVGRLQAQKDFSLAIKTATELKKREVSFIWYIVGEGAERTRLESEIVSSGLQRNFFLLGAKMNPYPYISKADVYVQTSLYEGRCVAVTEAQVLGKPCVVTNVQGLRELVVDGKTGRVVSRDAIILADAIMSLDIETREKYSREIVQTEKNDNANSIELFYKWIEE